MREYDAAQRRRQYRDMYDVPGDEAKIAKTYNQTKMLEPAL
jgi:hypothetical protein